MIKQILPGVYADVREIPTHEPPKPDNCRCEMGNPVLYVLQNSDVLFHPNKILKNGVATVVFWADGTKTVVKPADGIAPNDYEAFTAALAKKIFGNNSALKKVIQRNTVVQEVKPKAVKTIVETKAVKPVGKYRLNDEA